jgi:cell division protein FtsL
MTKRKNKKGLLKLEKQIYRCFVFVTVILVAGIIYSRATLGKINLEVQKLSGIIKTETEDNQSLVMKINEMVSLDKIQKVSTELGLTYNNNNIKSVTE